MNLTDIPQDTLFKALKTKGQNITKTSREKHTCKKAAHRRLYTSTESKQSSRYSKSEGKRFPSETILLDYF